MHLLGTHVWVCAYVYVCMYALRCIKYIRMYGCVHVHMYVVCMQSDVCLDGVCTLLYVHSHGHVAKVRTLYVCRIMYIMYVCIFQVSLLWRTSLKKSFSERS